VGTAADRRLPGGRVWGARPRGLRDVVWDPLGKAPELVRIQNPAAKLDRAKREIVAARFFEIPAEAAVEAGQEQRIEGRLDSWSRPSSEMMRSNE
jgi:hypothetical protein